MFNNNKGDKMIKASDNKTIVKKTKELMKKYNIEKKYIDDDKLVKDFLDCFEKAQDKMKQDKREAI
tara:strand:+ start:13 stop:210 length:198 start_codon:yes stop_codon:yes gene_type:complete